MNNVDYNWLFTKKNSPMNIKELMDVCKAKDGMLNETAFIGRCGIGPDHSLYLIIYDGVVLAENPNSTWTRSGCDIVVDRFVNIGIKVLEN